VRRSDLIRRLSAIPGPLHPRADLEQLPTPPEIAADLVLAVRADGLLDGATVLDLGSGTGRLAIAAALAGAGRVEGIEIDLDSVEIARANADGLPVRFEVGDVRHGASRADVVVMNPPFGAQRRHADRPFWDAAFAGAQQGIYAFGLRSSREFIERRVRASGAEVRRLLPIEWPLAQSLPHHRRPRVELSVDRWDLALGTLR